MNTTTSRTRTVSQKSLLDRLQQIASAGADLHKRALRGEPMGPRELAQVVELNQRYVDVLEEMETAPLNVGQGVTVEMDGQKIRFDDMDSFADWIVEANDGKR
jgi:hypothetical protein